MSWSFVLTDLAMMPVGEIINAYDRKIDLRLSGIDGCTFRVRYDNVHAQQLAATAGYVKAYRDGVLTFAGPIIGAEQLSETGGTIAVTCAGMPWNLSKRWAGKSLNGYAPIAFTDRSYVAAALVTAANAEGSTGIYVDTVNFSSGSLISGYRAGPYKVLLECIQELGQTVNGFDWRVLPRENWVNGARVDEYLGTLTIREVIGSTRENAVFEHGTTSRNNLASYTRSTDRSTQANRVYHTLNSASLPDVVQSEPASISEWGLVEDVLNNTDLTDATLRQALVGEHVTVRKNPKQTISITPSIDPQLTGRVPLYPADYDLGDIVRARAVYRNTDDEEVVVFDVWTRIFGIGFELDSNGIERVTLTTKEE